MPTAAAPAPDVNFPWPDGIRGAVSLTFDDSRPSQIDHGVPLFDRYGVRATFYVVPARYADRRDDWRRAVMTGHEAGGHTMSHPCTTNFRFADAANTLEAMTLDRIEAELVESNALIEQQLGVRPVGFAYPCGQKFVGRGVNLQSYVPLVAKHYTVGRGWCDEYFNAPDRCDLAQVAGIPIDGLTPDEALSAIRQATDTGNWLVFAGHDIEQSTGRQVTRLDTLEAICAHCSDPSNGVWLDTAAAIGQYISEHRP